MNFLLRIIIEYLAIRFEGIKLKSLIVFQIK